MISMRYRLILLSKLVGAFTLAYWLQDRVEHLFPVPPPLPAIYGHEPTSMFLTDMPFTFAILATWLISAAGFFAIVWDHRRRCRTCYRRLIMPIVNGSWGHMVIFGRPRIEWICPYGHGTLHVEELQITGTVSPNWHAHGDNIWKELESYPEVSR